MAGAPALFSNYILPFDVILGPWPVLASGHDVLVDCSPPAPPGSESTLAQVFQRFGRLARTGAFGSALVPPRDAKTGDVVLATNGGVIIRACRVDERAAVVLAHLLLAQQGELGLRSARLTVSSSFIGDSAFRLLETRADQYATYPDRPDSLPFEIEDDDPSGDSRTFTADFSRELKDSEQALLVEALRAWAVVVQAGGYGAPPASPEQSYLEPNAPMCWGSGFEYSFLKLRADGHSTDGIVNIFEAFHYRVCPLAALTIA